MRIDLTDLTVEADGRAVAGVGYACLVKTQGKGPAVGFDVIATVEDPFVVASMVNRQARLTATFSIGDKKHTCRGIAIDAEVPDDMSGVTLTIRLTGIEDIDD